VENFTRKPKLASWHRSRKSAMPVRTTLFLAIAMFLSVAGSCTFTAAADDKPSVRTNATKPNFTGTWRLYTGSRDVPGQEIDLIDHKEAILVITPMVGRMDVVPSYTYRIDGKNSPEKSGDEEVTRNAHWEGKMLVLETRITSHGVERLQREAMSLSADGTVLTKGVYQTGSDQSFDQTTVFHKVSDASSLKTISIGQTVSEVTATMGAPDSVVDLGTKVIYVYRDMKVTFKGGKVSDVQ
jgi:hypothetical protein